MKDAETPIQRAMREAYEQEERERAEREEPKPATSYEPETRQAMLMLQLEYTQLGDLRRIVGACQGIHVITIAGTLDERDIARAATETLRLGGLKALLG